METIFFFFLKKKPTRENFEWKEQVNILNLLEISTIP